MYTLLILQSYRHLERMSVCYTAITDHNTLATQNEGTGNLTQEDSKKTLETHNTQQSKLSVTWKRLNFCMVRPNANINT